MCSPSGIHEAEATSRLPTRRGDPVGNGRDQRAVVMGTLPSVPISSSFPFGEMSTSQNVDQGVGITEVSPPAVDTCARTLLPATVSLKYRRVPSVTKPLLARPSLGI